MSKLSHLPTTAPSPQQAFQTALNTPTIGPTLKLHIIKHTVVLASIIAANPTLKPSILAMLTTNN